jgi:hypothetical protein
MIINIDIPLNTPLPAIELTEPPFIDNPDEIKDFVEEQSHSKEGSKLGMDILRKI